MDLDDTLTYTATSINVGDPADTPTVVAAENFDGATRTFSGDSDSIQVLMLLRLPLLILQVPVFLILLT